MAVERVRKGEPASEVIAAYGFSRTTIYKWLNKAKGRGRGLAALRSRKACGPVPLAFLLPAALSSSRRLRAWGGESRTAVCKGTKIPPICGAFALIPVKSGI